MSIDRKMDKEDMLYIYNGVLLGYKKEWNNAICSNMNGSMLVLIGSEPGGLESTMTEWKKERG